MEYKCPRDGSVLFVPDAVIWDWQTAPLQCGVCLHGFWLHEIEPASLVKLDVKNRTFRGTVWVGTKTERAAAFERGHGVSNTVKLLLSERQKELAIKMKVIPNES